jgi:hypothetical protein
MYLVTQCSGLITAKVTWNIQETQHPDRNAQFEHINEMVRRQLAAGEPAISVDTKKKELVGAFKNAGRELQPLLVYNGQR